LDYEHIVFIIDFSLNMVMWCSPTKVKVFSSYKRKTLEALLEKRLDIGQPLVDIIKTSQDLAYAPLVMEIVLIVPKGSG
jgi:hypothetical protein